MSRFLIAFVLASIAFPLFGSVDESVLPSMDAVYTQNFGKKVNAKQMESIRYAIKNQDKTLRVMTYNMLYNVKEAEDKLPSIHRWDCRKPRLLKYLSFAKADIIGSQ